MRKVFWIFGLFALAVGVALVLRFNRGYALFVSPPYRVEISLNLLVVSLIAAFVAGYVLLRFVFAAVGLPRRVREFRVRRERERAHATLLDALRAFFEGRYGRAEKAAASTIEIGATPALDAVLAARAAHQLRRYEQRDAYLARAAELAPDDVALRIIAQVEMLLEQHRHIEALTALKQLPERHTAGLRLELRAQQQAKNWEQVLTLLDQLERRGVFDETQRTQLRRYAHSENLKRKTLDPRELEECWRNVPSRYQRDAKIAAVAAQCFAALGDHTRANHIIEQTLEEEWNSELAGFYAEYEEADVIRQIEHAEQWLAQHPHDAVLLLTLGKLCARQKLWGKAQSYLEASLSIEATYSAHLALARLHEQLGRTEEAQRHYRESLELAALQLKEITGGRRRMSF